MRDAGLVAPRPPVKVLRRTLESAGVSLENRYVRWAVGISLFLYGAAGPGSLMAWLALLSGSTRITDLPSGLLLAAVLFGLGAGSLFSGRAANFLESPLRAAAFLLFAAGWFGVFAPSLFTVLDWICSQVSREVGVRGAALEVLRLALPAGLVLVPSLLLGGVLPLLIELIRPGHAGRSLSGLYFLSSLGAVTGLCAGSFVLVPHLGLRGSSFAWGCASAVAGALVYAAARLFDSGAEFHELARFERSVRAKRRQADRAPLGIRDRRLLAGTATSGFGGMLGVLALTHYLTQIFGPSPQSRALLLTTVITGLALGTLTAARRLTRHCDLHLLFAASQVAASASLLLPLVFYERLPYWSWRISALLARTDEAYPLYLAVEYLVSLTALLLPAFFLGLGLAAATSQLTRYRGAGREAGRVLGGSLVGAAAGLVLTGYALLPLVGIQWTLKIGALSSLTAACVVLARAGAAAALGPARRRGAGISWILSAASAVLAPIVVCRPNADQRLLSFRPEESGADPSGGFASYRAALLRQRLLHAEDRAGARIVVLESQPGVASLLVNGRVEATSGAGLSTQKLAAQLPLIFHRDPRDVLLVSDWRAAAASVLSHHPGGAVDWLEDLPAVAPAAGNFGPATSGSHREPPSKVAGDVRRFLRSVKSRYDVIVSEPLSPWALGTAEFFTADFYRDCSLCLREGGLMAQVLPAREFSDPLLQLVLRTFLRSFPNAYLFNTGGPGDYVVLGSRGELALEFERWEERLGRPEVLADLAEIKVRDLLGLLALQSHSRETLTGFAGGGEVNTDDRPILENAGAPALFAGRKSEVLSLLDERRGAGRRLFIAGYLKRHRPGSENLRAAAELFRTGDPRNPPLFFSALREYLHRAPGDLKAWHLLSDELLRAGRNQEALDALEEAWKVAGGVEGAELKILRRQAAILVPSERESLTPLSAEAAFAGSREILERCLSLDAANHDLYFFELAKLAILEADGKTAAEWLKRAADYRRKHAALRSSAITDGEVEEMLRRAEGR